MKTREMVIARWRDIPVNRPARILIVDDHPLVREALAKLLAQENDLLVCGEADAATKAVALIGKTTPDLVVADLSLKNSGGLDFLKKMRLTFPNVSVLVFSIYDDPVWIERAIEAGAAGYVSKREATKNIIAAIRSVLAGKVHVSPALAQRLVAREARSHQGAKLPDPPQFLPPSYLPDPEETDNLELCQTLGLTPREAEVLTWVAQGKTNFEIGKIINARTGTICKHVEHILTKLKVENRTSAAAMVYDRTQQLSRHAMSHPSTH